MPRILIHIYQSQTGAHDRMPEIFCNFGWGDYNARFPWPKGHFCFLLAYNFFKDW